MENLVNIPAREYEIEPVTTIDQLTIDLMGVIYSHYCQSSDCVFFGAYLKKNYGEEIYQDFLAISERYGFNYFNV